MAPESSPARTPWLQAAAPTTVAKSLARRLVIVGCCGAGKSTLANKIAGGRRVWVPDAQSDNGSCQWVGAPGPFDDDWRTSTIRRSAVNFMGDPERPLVVVDTPGHDSESFVLEDDEVVSAAIQVERQAEELVDALRKLDHVHAILVLHNDVYSNRLNPITYELLVKVDEIFGAVDGHSVWQNIIVAYSKCDSDAKGWRDSLKTKKLAMQAALCSRFERCRTTVPVMCVSGLSLEGPVDGAWLRNPAMRRLSPSGFGS